MRESEKECIRKNFSRLLELTNCNVSFLAIFFQKNVLSIEDIQQIKTQNTSSGMAWELYNKLFTRAGSYAVLLDALEETNQTGAVVILRQNLVFYELDRFSSLQTCTNLLKSSLAESRSNIHPSYLHAYDTCINKYHFEINQVLKSKTVSEMTDTLLADHNRILDNILTRFKQMCDRNPTTQVSPRQITEFRWRLEQSLESLYIDYERKWEAKWNSTLASASEYMDSYKQRIRDVRRQVMTNSRKLETEILDYMEEVKSAKDEFRRKFKNLSEDFLKSCLDEMESYANTNLMDVFKLLRKFPFPETMISHDTLRNPTADHGIFV